MVLFVCFFHRRLRFWNIHLMSDKVNRSHPWKKHQTTASMEISSRSGWQPLKDVAVSASTAQPHSPLRAVSGLGFSWSQQKEILPPNPGCHWQGFQRVHTLQITELFIKTIHILLMLKALSIWLEIKTAVSLKDQPYQHNQAASSLCSASARRTSAQTPQTPHPGPTLSIMKSFLVKHLNWRSLYGCPALSASRVWHPPPQRESQMHSCILIWKVTEYWKLGLPMVLKFSVSYRSNRLRHHAVSRLFCQTTGVSSVTVWLNVSLANFAFLTK